MRHVVPIVRECVRMFYIIYKRNNKYKLDNASLKLAAINHNQMETLNVISTTLER